MRAQLRLQLEWQTALCVGRNQSDVGVEQGPGEATNAIDQESHQTRCRFFLNIDRAIAEYPARNNTKPSRNWWKFGFPVFYITDLLQLAEAMVNLGYGKDKRLTNTLDFIREKQNEQGQWLMEFDYTGKTWADFGEKKRPNKWVTLRALKVLKAVD